MIPGVDGRCWLETDTHLPTCMAILYFCGKLKIENRFSGDDRDWRASDIHILTFGHMITRSNYLRGGVSAFLILLARPGQAKAEGRGREPHRAVRGQWQWTETDCARVCIEYIQYFARTMTKQKEKKTTEGQTRPTPALNYRIPHPASRPILPTAGGGDREQYGRVCWSSKTVRTT